VVIRKRQIERRQAGVSEQDAKRIIQHCLAVPVVWRLRDRDSAGHRERCAGPWVGTLQAVAAHRGHLVEWSDDHAEAGGDVTALLVPPWPAVFRVRAGSRGRRLYRSDRRGGVDRVFSVVSVLLAVADVRVSGRQ